MMEAGEAEEAEETEMDRLLARYYRDAAIIIVIGAGAGAYFFGPKMAGGIALGGMIAVYNVRGIAKTLKGIDLTNPSVAGIMFGGVFRLLLVSAFIVLVAMARIVDLFGLLGGFFVATMLIAVEGLRDAREARHSEALPGEALQDEVSQGEDSLGPEQTAERD
jgi:hypothetical protein